MGYAQISVSFALAALEAQDTIRVEYSGLRVLDLEALRFSFFPAKKASRALFIRVKRYLFCSNLGCHILAWAMQRVSKCEDGITAQTPYSALGALRA